MWVFTREGFFSAVWDRDCGADELTIKAQCKQDICRLVKRLSGYCDEGQIVKNWGADYRYRIKVAKQAWSAYLADCALQVDYPVVKDAIAAVGDDLRKDAYYEVWETLYRWRSRQDDLKKGQRDKGEARNSRKPFGWNRR